MTNLSHVLYNLLMGVKVQDISVNFALSKIMELLKEHDEEVLAQFLEDFERS